MNAFRDTPTGTLRLNVPRPAAHLLLAPVMARFLRANPQMHLEIVADDGLVDIVSAGFDAGIRLGESLERDMIAVAIGPLQRFAIVGSPAYFDGREKAGLAKAYGHIPGAINIDSASFYRWKFEKRGRALEVDVDGPLTLGEPELMARAALDGVGRALAFEGYVEAPIAAGRLVRVLEDWCPAFPGFHLYYPSRRQVPAGLRAFIEMVREG